MRTDRRTDTGPCGLLAEQREPLIGERVQAAQALLNRFEAEGSAPGEVNGVADLRAFESILAELVLVELFLQHDALGLALTLVAAEVGDGCAQFDHIGREQSRSGIPHN